MASELNGLRVAFLVSNEGIEQAELTAPWEAVREAGGTPVLIAPEPGEAQGFNHLTPAGKFPVDHTFGEVSHAEYGAVVIPGGVANSDVLRTVPDAVSFVQGIFAAGKPAAVICHGPWLLVEAGLTEGRTLTSWPSLQTDIRNAGGSWVDTEVQICPAGPNTLITSRKPDDLPVFCSTLTQVFAKH